MNMGNAAGLIDRARRLTLVDANSSHRGKSQGLVSDERWPGRVVDAFSSWFRQERIVIG